MSIEGAGKGDTYRQVKRDLYNKNFDNIKFETVKEPQRWVIKNGKYRKVYPAKSTAKPNPAYK